MLMGETYVLEGVRDILRKKLGLTGSQCDCEYDEQIPAIAGDVYLAVIGAGFETGPNHGLSDGVHDILHSVQILVINRQIIARDRRRSVFLERLFGVNLMIDRVIKALDKQLDALSYINALMYSELPTASPFLTPLQLTRADSKPRMVNSEIYGGAIAGAKGTTPYVAMVRSVVFGKMRRMQTVTQIPFDGAVA